MCEILSETLLQKQIVEFFVMSFLLQRKHKIEKKALLVDSHLCPMLKEKRRNDLSRRFRRKSQAKKGCGKKNAVNEKA